MEGTATANANVMESWALYDTILICNHFYGAEQTVRGWYTTFAGFAAQVDHKFFKVRNEATAGLPYCNLQSADSMDYPFLAYSMGISFFAPAPNIAGEATPGDGIAGRIAFPDPAFAHFFLFDLPRHCSVQFKTNQDVRAECTAYAAPPGYGPMGGGAAFQMTESDAGPPIVPGYKQHAQMNFYGTQGVPVLTNRFKFPKPVEIAKNSVIEATLSLSEYARYALALALGPQNYAFQNLSAIDVQDFFPQRFGIQFSLVGMRLIQQRGQYHV